MAQIDTDLSPRAVRRSIRFLFINVVLLTIWTTCVGGVTFSGLLNTLGLSDVQIGLIMALPSLFLPMQLLGSIIQQKFFTRKRYWSIFGTLFYSSYILLPLLTALWMKLPHELAVLLFIAAFGFTQASGQMIGSVSTAWMGDVVPAREAISFWNRRNAAALISTMIASLIVGRVIDFLGNDQKSTYITVMSVGVVFGLVSSVFVGLLPECGSLKEAEKQHFSITANIKEVFKNRQFNMLLLFWVAMTVANSAGGGFYTIYLFKDMHLSMTTVQLAVISGALSGLLGAVFFRVVGKQCGNKPVLIACTVGKAVEYTICGLTWVAGASTFDRWGNGFLQLLGKPFGWEIPPAENGLFTIIPAFMLAGFFNAGMTSAQLALLTTSGPRNLRSTAIAIFSAITGLVAFSLISLSGFWYEALGRAMQSANCVKWTPFNVLYVVMGIGYLLCLPVLKYLREEGSADPGSVLRILLTGNPVKTVYQAHVLSQPIGEVSRSDRFRRIHSELISNELVQGLYSPSGRVRDSALLSISSMDNGDLTPEIRTELINLLDIPELGMQAMAARTLGRLHVKESLDRLISHFDDPAPAIAHACIFASGLIGDPRAEKALLALLKDPRFPDRWPHAAEALSRLGDGDHRYIRPIFPLLQAERFPVLRRQMMISLSRLVMENKNQAYKYFDAETRQPGTVIEQLIKMICSSGEDYPEISDWLNCYDRKDYQHCIQLLLIPQLALYGITPEDGITPERFLSRRFTPSGLRDKVLRGNSYAADNLYLQLKLWSEIQYESDEDARLLMLTALIAAVELLKHRKTDASI